jgi:hypothetical protein
LGIKITLTLCHVSGIYSRARQAVKILTSVPDKIPSSPIDLKELKFSIAHLILSESTASDTTSQSFSVGVLTGIARAVFSTIGLKPGKCVSKISLLLGFLPILWLFGAHGTQHRALNLESQR